MRLQDRDLVSLCRISIPVWYDYEAKWKTTHLWLTLISIPVWYDYESDTDRYSTFTRKFQFQYGTIMRRMQYVYNDSLAAFQFQYGTIMRTMEI